MPDLHRGGVCSWSLEELVAYAKLEHDKWTGWISQSGMQTWDPGML